MKNLILFLAGVSLLLTTGACVDLRHSKEKLPSTSISDASPSPETPHEDGVKPPPTLPGNPIPDPVPPIPNPPKPPTGELPVGMDFGTPAGFKIAFIGDQGDDKEALDVMNLIKAEKTDLVLHQGDLDYGSSPDTWDGNINKVLGSSFAYLASAGNHDAEAWPGYRSKIAERVSRIPGMSCSGDIGVNATCIYKGIWIVLSGVGSIGSGHQDYLRQSFADKEAQKAIWKICSWHKQQRAYQVGAKGDSTGWEVYTICRENGAIIAQGHEHSYSRTHAMSNFEKRTIYSTDGQIPTRPGVTFAFTQGLGGQNVRDQELCLRPGECPYWASIYTSNQNATFGALFCSFNDGGVPNKARCYFKNIEGKIIDQFTLLSGNGPAAHPENYQKGGGAGILADKPATNASYSAPNRAPAQIKVKLSTPKDVIKAAEDPTECR